MSAQIYTLKNKLITSTLTNYGARWVSLLINDKNGNPVDVVAGFASVADYQKATAPYYGATIGRFANRIAHGRIELNGHTYQLPVNNGTNSLHGGSGFHDKIWDVVAADEQQITMKYTSPDGEDGYPGQVETTVIFTLQDDALRIDYTATTDATTVINLTNHAYFNLNGEGSGSIEQHSLYINADAMVPVNSNLIPTGQLAAVAGTPFDFRTEQTIGARIEDDNEQLAVARGYDHTYVLNKTGTNALTLAARLTGDVSGIIMEVETTEPGMQLYTGNFMTGTNTFKGGATDDFRTTLALETQHFPDSPNQPAFPSTVLNPGETFQSATIYRFSVRG